MAMRAVVFCLAISCAAALRVHEANAVSANPIRKVVTMLQAMQHKVQEEGKKEEELYEKYQCYCKNAGGDLSASISAAEAKAPQVTSAIEEGEASAAQLKQDLKQHQSDRDEAKSAMAEATKLREKEASEFAGVKSEADANIAAIHSAVSALEKGMAGGFLQTGGAQVLKKIVLGKQDMLDADRQDVLAFLSGDAAYAPQSGQITGILKEMGDEMAKDLAEATSAEEESIKNYDALMSAKHKEVESLTHSIETKTQRAGELAVEIVQMKNDLSETQAQLLEDKKFLAGLDANCATNKKDFEERSKTRAEELVALADTIKILNDDDALDLFKKTLPSAASSFVQVSNGAKRALAKLDAARRQNNSPSLDFLAMAIKGKKFGFEKVIKMIDDMVATLKQEQADDDHKREYCAAQFDNADDSKKKLERQVSDAETAIADAEEGLATVRDEIANLEDSIKKLDKSVAEATEQRQEEHSEYKNLLASDSAAKDLLNFAKNRLNKFYNKALYKPKERRELSREDRIVVNNGGTLAPTAAPGGIAGTGITAMSQVSAAPPPPPETFGAYTKKSEESNGVIAMIDLLIADLTKEVTEAETQEKDAQEDYTKAMSDAAAKRAQDAQALTEKTGMKADLEGRLQTHKEEKTSSTKELMATEQYIASLHAECDWLVSNFDVRKEARSSEIDSLNNAKAVLSGADYSFAQISSSTCPSTSFQCGMTKDAAGDTVYTETPLPNPDTCVNVAAQVPADGKFKICGPGTFSFSRMSCGRHDYKAVTIEQPADQFTQGDCKEYAVADYYQLHGYIGSAMYSCSATAR